MKMKAPVLSLPSVIACFWLDRRPAEAQEMPSLPMAPSRPNKEPTAIPTFFPTTSLSPTKYPTVAPTQSFQPSLTPSPSASALPSSEPSSRPSLEPTALPTNSLTDSLTDSLTNSQTDDQTLVETPVGASQLSTALPTRRPTRRPTPAPTAAPSASTPAPTRSGTLVTAHASDALPSSLTFYGIGLVIEQERKPNNLWSRHTAEYLEQYYNGPSLRDAFRRSIFDVDVTVVVTKQTTRREDRKLRSARRDRRDEPRSKLADKLAEFQANRNNTADPDDPDDPDALGASVQRMPQLSRPPFEYFDAPASASSQQPPTSSPLPPTSQPSQKPDDSLLDSYYVIVDYDVTLTYKTTNTSISAADIIARPFDSSTISPQQYIRMLRQRSRYYNSVTRVELTPNPPPAAINTIPQNQNDDNQDSSNSSAVIIIAVVITIAAIVLLMGAFLFYRRQRRNKIRRNQEGHHDLDNIDSYHNEEESGSEEDASHKIDLSANDEPSWEPFQQDKQHSGIISDAAVAVGSTSTLAASKQNHNAPPNTDLHNHPENHNLHRLREEDAATTTSTPPPSPPLPTLPHLPSSPTSQTSPTSPESPSSPNASTNTIHATTSSIAPNTPPPQKSPTRPPITDRRNQTSRSPIPPPSPIAMIINPFTKDADKYIYTDNHHQQRQYIILHVFAPPGKLGVVVDTPPNYKNSNNQNPNQEYAPKHHHPPTVCELRSNSILRNQLHLHDQLLAVDDEDVRHFSAIEVSRLLGSRMRNDIRKITVLRQKQIQL